MTTAAAAAVTEAERSAVGWFHVDVGVTNEDVTGNAGCGYGSDHDAVLRQDGNQSVGDRCVSAAVT